MYKRQGVINPASRAATTNLAVRLLAPPSYLRRDELLNVVSDALIPDLFEGDVSMVSTAHVTSTITTYTLTFTLNQTAYANDFFEFRVGVHAVHLDERECRHPMIAASHRPGVRHVAPPGAGLQPGVTK